MDIMQQYAGAGGQCELMGKEDYEQDALYLGEVKGHKSEWCTDILLNGDTISFKIDTGAAVTAIPTKMYRYSRDGPLTTTTKKLYGPSNTLLQVAGELNCQLKSEKGATTQPVYVVDLLVRPLLGLPAIEALHLVERLNVVEEMNFKEKFPKVFTGLGRLEGDYTILIREDATPYALTTPRRIPIPLVDKVKEELQRMEEIGVISRIERPLEWCAGMVPVVKPSGKIRICVDLTRLNEAVQRERHILPSVEQSLAQLNGATVFTKLDARSGFWQIPLAPKCRELTTFITPLGRFCFNVLPFGINYRPEHFQRRMSQLLDGIEGVICHADDVLICGTDKTQHDERLIKVLSCLQKAGLTLNEKCSFAQSELIFVGHKVSAAGIAPDPEKIRAVREMPIPQNVADVRRFLGMATYMGRFLPNFTDTTKPLRDLLAKESEWIWGTVQQAAFEKVKSDLTSERVLAQYKPNAKMSADASAFGIGGVLCQLQENSEWRPVAFISRSLSDIEQRYAQVEKEALALTWACEHLSSYLIGLHFTLETDHKPLLALLGSKGLDDLPPRIQRFRLRMLRFSYHIVHVPGKALITADALSRAPIRHSLSKEEKEFEIEAQVFVDTVHGMLPASKSKLEQIAEEQKKDNICAQLIDRCKKGWPRQEELPQKIKPYWIHQGELYIAKGLLIKRIEDCNPRKFTKRNAGSYTRRTHGYIKVQG